MESVNLIIRGVVQGVFFRANVERKARELGLKGYVKNLDNGNVEVRVEGNEGKIKELIEFCKNSPGSSKVEEIEVENKEIENFGDFSIRY